MIALVVQRLDHLVLLGRQQPELFAGFLGGLRGVVAEANKGLRNIVNVAA